MKSRNEDGLRILYSNYSSALYGIAFRMIQNRAHAEDALQKSFLKIWNNIDQYDDSKATLFTWMAKIVRNTAIDISRLRSFQNEQRSVEFCNATHGGTVSGHSTDKLDAQSLLSGLDHKYKCVLEYLYLQGFTQREVSEEFGIPLGTVKTRAKKALDLIRLKIIQE